LLAAALLLLEKPLAKKLTLSHNISFFRNRLLQEDDFTSEHLLLLEESLEEILSFFQTVFILRQRTYPDVGSTC